MIAPKNPRIQIFQDNAKTYDDWFDDHPILFQNELTAIKKLWPREGKGLEVGVGSGRFAQALGITEGVEPAENMAKIAEKRGVKVVQGMAEDLPYPNESFDKLLMVTTVCFLQDPEKAFQEAERVLRPNGVLVIGLLDRSSPYGKQLADKKRGDPFYREAVLHSTAEVLALLKRQGFQKFAFRQVLFGARIEEKKERARKGHGEGGFVVIRGKKAP